MISSAIVQSAIVLRNRRIKAERDVMTFVPVCSSVAGMHLHHLEGRRAAQAGSAPFEERPRSAYARGGGTRRPRHAVADVVVAASLCRGVQLALLFLATRRHSAVATTMLSRNRNGKGVRRGERLFKCALAFLVVLGSDSCRGGRVRRRTDSSRRESAAIF